MCVGASNSGTDKRTDCSSTEQIFPSLVVRLVLFGLGYDRGGILSNRFKCPLAHLDLLPDDRHESLLEFQLPGQQQGGSERSLLKVGVGRGKVQQHVREVIAELVVPGRDRRPQRFEVSYGTLGFVEILKELLGM